MSIKRVGFGLNREDNGSPRSWERSAVGHHVTNIVVTEFQDATHAISTGIGVMADGSCGRLTYLGHASPGRARLAHYPPADPRFETL